MMNCRPGHPSAYNIRLMAIGFPAKNLITYSKPNPNANSLFRYIRLRNDLYSVGWGVKLYSLNHSITTILLLAM